ncbi:MAG: DUF1292 domain-containing protein [Oscillospiraceae bacterium]
MTEEQNYNPDIYTLVDEEGAEQTFELLDIMEIDDDRYFALIPYFDDNQELVDDDGDLIILKSQLDDNGDELMVTIDDDEEYQRVGEIFLDKLSQIFEEEILDEDK